MPVNMKTVSQSNSVVYDHVLLRPDEQIGMHRHDAWEISYIIRGSGVRIIGDVEEPFRRGDLVLNVPDMPHVWKFDGADTDDDGNIENITVFFPSGMLMSIAEILPEYGEMAGWYSNLRESIKLDNAGSAGIRGLLMGMEHEQPRVRVISLLRLLELIYTERRFVTAGRFDEENQVKGRIKKLEIYMRCNYQRYVSLDDIAQHVGMSRSSLCTMFRKATGKTLFGYLVELRIAAAKRLLETEAASVSQCCYRSGFNDIPYFNRTFRRIVGMSPGEYRETAKAASRDSMPRCSGENGR